MSRQLLFCRYRRKHFRAEQQHTGTNEKGEKITISITVDSDTAYVNGNPVILESPAFIRDMRTYTPLRFIAENLGVDVDWNGDEKKISITKKLIED